MKKQRGRQGFNSPRLHHPYITGKIALRLSEFTILLTDLVTQPNRAIGDEWDQLGRILIPQFEYPNESLADLVQGRGLLDQDDGDGQNRFGEYNPFLPDHLANISIWRAEDGSLQLRDNLVAADIEQILERHEDDSRWAQMMPLRVDEEGLVSQDLPLGNLDMEFLRVRYRFLPE